MINKPELLASTAIVSRWNGESKIFWTYHELRVLGLTHRQIEHDAMTREVIFDAPPSR